MRSATGGSEEAGTVQPTEEMDVSMNGITTFAVMEHIADFKNGQNPVMATIIPCQSFHAEQIDQMKRSQMWDCLQDRDRILSECKYCITANDMLGGALDSFERAGLLADYLEALVELFPTCEAIYSLNTGKLIPAQTVRNQEAEGLDRYIRYIVNTRFFHIDGTNDYVVDTLGLSLLYIEDLQYHFHNMDPNWVVRHAYSMTSYILTNRCPIQEGDTIDGVIDGRLDQSLQWKCCFEDALVPPNRTVLDIYMNEYASGQR